MAALHRTGDTWRAVVGRVAGGKLKIVDSHEFRGDNSAIAPWLQGHGVDRTICILPGGSVICRTCQLPNASVDQLLPALQLQAEAYLLGTAPAHRSAMAVLHAAPGETSRSGIILAWPENTSVGVPDLNVDSEHELTYAPDVAALAALLNGSRPTEPLVWVDRSTGSVTMAITHANGAIFRATREDAASAEAWQQNVSRAVAETALSVGHTAPFIEALIGSLQSPVGSLGPDQGTLIVPDELAQQISDRVDAGLRSPAWWAEYGVAVGALLATTDQLAPLTRLRRAPVVETPSNVERWVNRLSDRTLAFKLIAASLALALISPLVFSGLRYGMLWLRHGDVRDERTAVREVEHKLALYESLAERWSMTKLLADVACNTPEGVEVDSLSLSTTRGVRMTGLARADSDRSALDVLNSMQKQLQDSSVFDQVDYSYEPADYGNYSFTLTADVRNPHYQVQYPPEMDFAKTSLRERRYPETAETSSTELAHAGAGEANEELADTTDQSPESDPIELAVGNGASGDERSSADEIKPTPGETLAAGDQPESEPSSARIANRGGSTPEGVERRSNAGSRGGPGSSPSMQIPEALSEDRIKAMNVDEVRAAMGVVGKARNAKLGDDDVKARLKREWDWLKARSYELQQAEQGGSKPEGD
jgi:hypothetical protein